MHGNNNIFKGNRSNRDQNNHHQGLNQHIIEDLITGPR